MSVRRGIDCLICGIDCLICGIDCLICGIDCLICGIDCLIYLALTVFYVADLFFGDLALDVRASGQLLLPQHLQLCHLRRECVESVLREC